MRSPKADISLIVDHAVIDYEWDDVTGMSNIDITLEYVGLCLVCRRTETYACQVGNRFHMADFYLSASNDNNKPVIILGLIKT
jgi:hypothetical protein